MTRKNRIGHRQQVHRDGPLSACGGDDNHLHDTHTKVATVDSHGARSAEPHGLLTQATAEGSSITPSSPTSSHRAHHSIRPPTTTNTDQTNLLSNISAELPEDSCSSSSPVAKLIVDLGREDNSTSTTATAASDTSTTITANSYSRNKSTTRSWPVIHRNNSYYRYYQGSSGSGGSGGGSGGGAGGTHASQHRRHPTQQQLQQPHHGYLQYDYDAPLLLGVSRPPNDTNNNTLHGYGTNNDYLLLASGGHYPPPDKSPSIDSCYYYQHYTAGSMQPSATTIMTTTTTGSQGGATTTTTTTTATGGGGAGGRNQPQQTPSGNGSCCSIPPPILFLFLTLLMTSSATAMLCAAIMTDHWEHVSWDRTSLDRISNESAIELQWYLDGRAAKIPLKGKGLPAHHHHQKGGAPSPPVSTDNRAGVFLVPMNGGIWTLCIDLTPDEIRTMSNDGFPQVEQCVNYLAGTMESAQGNDEDARADWQHRMQNLSISCSLVCLIILGSAALVGAFGVCQRQISAVLVTGVMYLLAALFALFTLMIIHFKRQQGRPLLDSDFDGTIDGVVAIKGTARAASKFLGARIFVTAWSLDLGWGGVVLCAFTSFLWILLSKIMRFNPLSAMI
ncbi:AGAP013010-PA-like protein [Anopheles sinensis]|uniref:AGAP013010-PA-like protein n=1 Tax=Anopheles sinensis TaxID=74873 RepID=A0A084W354_ANOSI|nr:AGAP013010-PA-like protein [Anopheles sinensis]